MKRSIRGISAILGDMFAHVETRIMCIVLYVRARYIERKTPRTILFYPHKPHPFHIIAKICSALGCHITNDPYAQADAYMYFEDTTLRIPDAQMTRLKKEHHVLNAECTDIGKGRVEKIFSEVFGYDLAINPRTYQGVAVRKSNTNALHDGVIVTCPREPQEGYVYERLIDARIDNDLVMDMRLHIFGDTIPFVAGRYKRATDRFNHTLRNKVCETTDVLSHREIETIVLFCKKFGLDYGEIDALRDNADGRLYIVDVNNTPYGPRAGKNLSRKEYRAYFARMTAAFESAFLH